MRVTLYEKLSLLIAALALAVDITFHLLDMQVEKRTAARLRRLLFQELKIQGRDRRDQTPVTLLFSL